MTKEVNAEKIRRYNLIAGVFHLLQMIVVLLLANDFSLPIVARYTSGPPGSTFTEPVALLNTPVGITVALFLGLSAFFHFLVASPKFFPRYSAGLTAGHNYFRWIEYSISSSVMIVLIAQICGITDVAALIAIFGVNASMILFGWLQEKYEQPGSGGWLPLADLVTPKRRLLSTESFSRFSYCLIHLPWCNFSNLRKSENGLTIFAAKKLT